MTTPTGFAITLFLACGVWDGIQKLGTFSFRTSSMFEIDGPGSGSEEKIQVFYTLHNAIF